MLHNIVDFSYAFFILIPRLIYVGRGTKSHDPDLSMLGAVALGPTQVALVSARDRGVAGERQGRARR